MKTILVGLFLVLSISASDLYEQEAFFRRLIQKDYGKTIIQTIQLELGQDNAVNKILVLLRQLLDDLNAENTRSSTYLKEREDYCQGQIYDVDEYTERVLRNKADYERALPLRQEELRDKDRQTQQRNAELQRNKDRVVNFARDRQLEHQEYEQRRDELIGMVNGLKQAQNIIRQLKPNGSFADIRESVLAQLSQHSKKLFEEIPRKTGFQALSQMLLELSSDSKIHADGDSVQVILNIIDELIESIYGVQKQEMFVDDQKTKYFQQDLVRLQIENNRLAGLNTTDNAVLELLQSRLRDLLQQIAVAQSVLESKEIERAQYMTQCQEERDSWRYSSDIRQENSEIIRQLIDLFENSFSDRIRTMLADITI